ncbi:uncharacterized protein LOC110462378 isoform X2 [Mizuhopecten yessoensis]|uniref:uncharacterized protein LOC110462378 isoform X2 n=1 Tax=Mizuhopecten yessoensis TaxID=6573 RepID=UPI000B45AC5A|nr:uncharacterized protein LOC110462378 isoform X2 [Mizuhopecten yessoensis]
MLRQRALRDVQNEFKNIIEKEAKNYELMNLEIFNCSPEGSFKSANIRMPLFGIEEPVPTDPPTPWHIFMFEYEDVFNLKNLELLVQDKQPGDSDVDPDLMAAYNSLVDYIAGAIQIWHGFADILISQKIPLKIWKEVPEIVTNEHDEDSEEDSDSVTEGASLSPCAMYSLNIETKKNDLAMKQPLCQLIAQTITNSFAQVNENKQLSQFLIPSFGCSNNQIVIFGYDSENDVLVKKVDPILLWTGADNIWHLSVSAVVQIWMYMHFPLLMLPSLANQYDTNIRSNFHSSHTIEFFRKYSKCQTKGFPHEGGVKLLNTRYSRPTKKLKTN